MKRYEEGVTEDHARIDFMEQELQALRVALKPIIARLYHIHPDDLSV